MTQEISLFPLNVVLFPGMPLPLHIFEERYKAMIQRCLNDNAPLGVVLIREGSEVGRPATPHRIGTCAHIVRAERLPDGRMNLLTVGTDRFQIADLWEEDSGYLRGNVTFFEDAAPSGFERTAELGQRARRLLAPYLSALIAGLTLREKDIPDQNPASLSLWIAPLLNAPDAFKQSLLEMTSTTERLKQEIELMERQSLLRRIQSPGETAWAETVLEEKVFLN
jgi:Lon protease-like protein